MDMHKIMVIRHAEKPDAAAGIAGVSDHGAADNDDLTVRGWQRAGALVRLFSPVQPLSADGMIARPHALFATAPTSDNPSRRPLHTIKPLSQDLVIEIDKRFVVHEEDKLLDAAKSAGPVVLISWHHERIDNIAKLLGVTTTGKWPDQRFDLVWVFNKAATGWGFYR
jgi:hypothetical protein